MIQNYVYGDNGFFPPTDIITQSANKHMKLAAVEFHI